MSWLRGAIAVALSIAAGLLCVVLAGGSAGDALHAVLVGAVGDRSALADTVNRATPLCIVGLGLSLAFRAGALNIGAEGQILGGACAAAAAGIHLHGLPALLAIPCVLGAAALGGALTAAAAAALRRWRGSPRGPLHDPPQLRDGGADLMARPRAAPGAQCQLSAERPDRRVRPFAKNPPADLHARGALVALGLVPLVWCFLFRTAAGLRLRAAGAGPAAARFAGFHPATAAAWALVASGAFAGLAGGVQVSGLTGRLYADLSGGVGYMAIASGSAGAAPPGGDRRRVAPLRSSRRGRRRNATIGRRVGGAGAGGAGGHIVGIARGGSPRPPGSRGGARLMEAIEQVLRQSVGQATAIALAALGETLVESAGVLNLSLEGTILSAAFAGALGAEWSGSAEVGLLCGVGAAVAFSALFGLVVLWLRADEVIAGTAMNLLAGGTTAVFWRAAHGLGGAPTAVPHFSTIRVPLLADIPIIGPALFEHHLFTFAIYAAAPLVWVWLRRSGAGLRLRACGESPAAASAMGIPVRRTRFLAILACGALAGLAGVCLSLAQTSTFVDGMSAGRGFVAIALVIFGAHHSARRRSRGASVRRRARAPVPIPSGRVGRSAGIVPFVALRPIVGVPRRLRWEAARPRGARAGLP